MLYHVCGKPLIYLLQLTMWTRVVGAIKSMMSHCFPWYLCHVDPANTHLSNPYYVYAIISISGMYSPCLTCDLISWFNRHGIPQCSQLVWVTKRWIQARIKVLHPLALNSSLIVSLPCTFPIRSYSCMYTWLELGQSCVRPLMTKHRTVLISRRVAINKTGIYPSRILWQLLILITFFPHSRAFFTMLSQGTWRVDAAELLSFHESYLYIVFAPGKH